jgi:hypothetical protein
MPYTPLSTANTLQSWRLRINDIDSVKVETPNPTTSGALAHTGRARISTNLYVAGNTVLGDPTNVSERTTINGTLFANGNINLNGNTVLGAAGKVANVTGWFGVTGRQSVSTNLFVGGNTITDIVRSKDSNLIYKFDTANKRVLTNIYGFDFIDNGGIITPTNKTRYQYGSTGANQTLVVPAGVSYIFVKMWGAGGGGGSYGGWRQGSLGGAGGFSHGIIQVVPGETITIRVGGRGLAIPANALSYPDGGRASVGTADNRYAGSGGGSSSILVPSQSNQYVIVAGGGGGGGSMNGFELNSGGAGGGLIGECAAITPTGGQTNNGKGGTQSAGGAGGTGNVAAGPGGSFDGGDNGNSAPYGGGGGGGFFGGGAGGYNASNVMGGGGGGSGRIHSSVIMGATYTGQSFIPPFFDDPDLAIDSTFRYARGGDEGGHGGHGLVVLYY